MNKFVTAFDAILGSPFLQKSIFSLTFLRHFTERAQNFDYLIPFRFPSPAVIRLLLYQHFKENG